MTFRHCVAVDLGASSGRVMLATWDCDLHTLTLREMHRFANCLQKQDGFVTWDIDALEAEIRTGLHNVCEDGIRIDSIGIDGLMAHAIAQLGKENIYGRSGIQFLPFNTLYQLRALVEQQPELVEKVAHALLIPDYLSYRLTGNMNWEYTNATTTQLVNINTDNWDEHLLAWTGASPSWFGAPTHPGNVIGHWLCPQGNEIPVVAVASHDTSDAALAANITNEGGAEGRYRVLKNIMGLWLLQRVLKEQNITDLPALIAETETLKACTFLINPNDDRFINPVHMSAEIQAACFEAGQPVPSRSAELARCIFDSLALLYADILSELADLRGKPFTQLHIVGGGCQNQLLNQLCADACGITVVAGPVEASTLGNIGIQLMTLDELSNVDDFRSVVTANNSLTTFTPHPCHEIARYRAQFQQKRLTKELCA